jgi:DNA-directed RNA polymerase subunit RPC12/RpoP
MKSGKNNGAGQGKGLGSGGGHGKNNGGGFSVGGYCVCTKCGTKVQHQQGVKCTTLKCPDCGHTMIREELLNDKHIED